MIFTRILSERWKAEGITVNSLHPGVVDTGLMSGWDNRVMKAIFQVVQRFFISAERGALTSIFLASDPTVGRVTGQYFDKRRPRAYNPIADDVATQSLLWEESMTALKQAGIAGIQP
jgi:NAD(P)-dependent dehydrogenase (short-subunit alcohol dehydrogenase family)